MTSPIEIPLSRRSFLKWSGAATAAAAVGGKAPVLYALTPDESKEAFRNARVPVFGVRHVPECLRTCGKG